MEPKQLRGVASTIIGTGSKFMPLPSAHAHDTNGQCRTHRLHIYGLEIVLLLLSQTSIIAVDYDLEGVLELELDNVMEMDGKCAYIRGLF